MVIIGQHNGPAELDLNLLTLWQQILKNKLQHIER